MTTAEMRDEAKRLWDEGTELQAKSYDLEVAICHSYGDDLRAEFYASLAACYRQVEGAQERKERAYAALRARDGNGASPAASPAE